MATKKVQPSKRARKVARKKSAVPAVTRKHEPRRSTESNSSKNRFRKILSAISTPHPLISATLISFLRLSIALLCVAVAIALLSIPDWRWFASQFNSSEVLKYLTVLIWPIVVLLVAAYLRPDVPKLLKRGFKFFLPWGGSIEVDAEIVEQSERSGDREKLEQASEELQQAEEVKKESEVSSVANSPAASSAGNVRRTATTGFTLDIDNQKELVAHFERAASRILGSQLEALILLSTYNEGLTISDLQGPFQRYKNRAPAVTSSTDFFTFMRFLTAWYFADYSPETGIFKINEIGNQFLEYRGKKDLKLSPENANR